MTKPAASVVIATRDRARLLAQCLDALARQTASGRFEVIVVDNASADGTPDVIAQAARRDAAVRGIHVAMPNRAKARNAGIALAEGALIVFCDDDTLPPAGFVDAHLSAHAEAKRTVVSGPIINVPDVAHLPPPAHRFYSRAFLCTCNASVSRADLLAVDGFDEGFELYGWEDTDLGVAGDVLERRRLRGIR
ncbi:MAG TPA: glycosyltransferase [Candidatus Eremiobacteraceae bacterium]|nr:glycosyltransferase [Candidatus Eremiobacteraceae bacterium]